MILSPALSNSLPSAPMESPASRQTMSPGTISAFGISLIAPSLITFTFGIASSFRLASECSALICCTVPKIAFMVMTATITIQLSISPSTAEMVAAAININTSTSKNCPRNIAITDCFFPSGNSFFPYCSCLFFASCVVRPVV